MNTNECNAIPVEFIKERMEDVRYKWGYASKKVEASYRATFYALQNLLLAWERECEKH